MPSAFETSARKLRYQALGKACLQDDIKTLLLGHHRDDNVETVIWRLCTGGRGAGLGGISEVSRIPECYGLWGIAEGGSHAELLGTRSSDALPVRVSIEEKNRGKIEFHSPSKPPDTRNPLPGRHTKTHPPWVSLQPPLTSSPLLTATGGILLCRPLLSFPKTRLVETCIENKVPFVSDPTNFDPTLTTRNTIRHLLSNNALPRAFQSASILSLIEAGQHTLKRTEDLSNEVLASRCRLLNLNLKTGSMAIEFKDAPGSTDTAQDRESSPIGSRILSTAMRRVTDLIAPCSANHYPLSHYEPFVSKIFPGIGGAESRAKYLKDRKPFVAGGVLFSPLKPQSKLDPTDPTTPTAVVSIPGKNTWQLSRAPYMRNRSPKTQFELGTWTLWDDRHWLRFTMVPDSELNGPEYHGLKPPSLIVRPFERSDLERIHYEDGTLAGKYGRAAPKASYVWKGVQEILALEASGPVRETIPVLTLKGSSPSGRVETPEQLLLLPTFGMCLSGMKRGPAFNEMNIYWKGIWWKMTWDWNYKMIDTDAVRLMGGPDVSDKPTGYGTEV